MKYVVALLLALPLFADTPPAVIRGALAQVGVTRGYDPSYRSIRYPNGDVPLETGVCADVIVRAFRTAGIDLQVLIHEDMKAHFDAYPRNWGLRKPDTNIDHRRVPNLAMFFRRRGKALPVTGRASDWKPGDIVIWRLPSGVPHIGIVSNTVAEGARYTVVHNIGSGAQNEDVLFAWTVTGHYRW